MFVVVMVVMVVMSSNFFGDKGLMGSNFACGDGGDGCDEQQLFWRQGIDGQQLCLRYWWYWL